MTYYPTSTTLMAASGTVFCNPSTANSQSPAFYPLVAGSNITITGSTNGLIVSSSGGGGISSPGVTTDPFKRRITWQPSAYGSASPNSSYTGVTSNLINEPAENGFPAGYTVATGSDGSPHVVRVCSTDGTIGHTIKNMSFNDSIAQFDSNASFSQVVGFGAATDHIRVWFAFNNVFTLVISTDIPIADIAGFRYSTEAGDATWQTYTSDGSSSTIKSTSVTPAVNTVNKLTIVCDPTNSQVLFYIDNVLVETHTTTLPRAGQGGATCTYAEGRLNAARTVLVGKYYCETY